MTYEEARKRAQNEADTYGFDYGISRDAFGRFSVFMLPAVQNRCGHELRCEVVSCTTLARCQPGHGPCAGRR